MTRTLFHALALMLAVIMSCGMSLAAEDVSDESLYDQVRIRIASDRTIGGGKIEVAVNKGIVELTGTVKSEKIRTQAEKVAKKVKGVKSVDNKLRIGPM